jgi:hypothetical protein
VLTRTAARPRRLAGVELTAVPSPSPTHARGPPSSHLDGLFPLVLYHFHRGCQRQGSFSQLSTSELRAEQPRCMQLGRIQVYALCCSGAWTAALKKNTLGERREFGVAWRCALNCKMAAELGCGLPWCFTCPTSPPSSSLQLLLFSGHSFERSRAQWDSVSMDTEETCRLPSYCQTIDTYTDCAKRRREASQTHAQDYTVDRITTSRR